MSDCRRTVDRLAPYADEALPPAERAEIDRHLDACPPCRTAAAEERNARTVLRTRAGDLRTPALPPGLRSRCEAAAREEAHPPAAAWRGRFVPAALSAALVLFTVFVVMMLATQRSNTVLAAQLSADHSKCFRLFPPAGASLDAHDAEARLADRYGWDIHVPPSSAADGVRLIGARRCLYGDGRVPHLLYDADGQELSLFVIEGETRPPSDVTTLGHRARIWSRGPTTFVLVSPAEAGELARAVAYVRQEAH